MVNTHRRGRRCLPQSEGTPTQRIDVIIAAVLVVAAVGSAIGVVTYEDARGGTSFLVSWTTTTEDVSAAPEPHSGSGDATVEMPIPFGNLTRVSFDVAVAGTTARVQPTQVFVEVTGPGNQTQQAEATLAPGAPSTVTVPLSFDLAAVPTVDTVQASSPDGAQQRLAQQFSATDGTGTWTIRVSFAGTAPGPLAEPHTVTVRATAETYAATVTTETPDVNR